MTSTPCQGEALDHLVAPWAVKIARSSGTTVEAILTHAENVRAAVLGRSRLESGASNFLFQGAKSLILLGAEFFRENSLIFLLFRCYFAVIAASQHQRIAASSTFVFPAKAGIPLNSLRAISAAD